MLHLFQPLLGAPLLDMSLQIFFVEDTILHTEDLGVLPHLCEVRVDDVDDELVLGGTWGSHGTEILLKVFLAETDRERKHTKSRDMVPGRSGQIYSKNLCNRRKSSSQSGVGGGVRGAQEGARRDQVGGRARRPPGPPRAPILLHLGLEFS